MPPAGTPHDLPPWACPHCGAVLDEVRGIPEERRPRAGDYTLCIYCLAVLTFDADLHLRALPPATAAAALATLDVPAVQQVVAEWEEEDRT